MGAAVSARTPRRAAAALALALTAGGALAPPGSAAAAGPAAPLRLTIAFTGDVSGYLEPCG
jgi:hypothetical protein